MGNANVGNVYTVFYVQILYGFALFLNLKGFNKGGGSLVVNGREVTGFAGKTVTELLSELKLNQTLVVVEINFEIIPKDQYDVRILQETDKVEIISVVGGG